MRLIRFALTIGLLVSLTSAGVFRAQTPSTTIRGTVIRGGNGQPIPDVNVSLNPSLTFEALDAIMTAGSVLVMVAGGYWFVQRVWLNA